MDLEALMHMALAEAKKVDRDIPVGALVVDRSGLILATGFNRKEAKADASSHAEIEAIRSAGNALGGWRLVDCTLIVTLEPCVMCAGAAVAARLRRVVFGAWQPGIGAAGSHYDILRDAALGRPIEVIGGILEAECSQLISTGMREARTPTSFAKSAFPSGTLTSSPSTEL